MNRETRAAVSELLAIVGLLVDASTPHAKALAFIVLARVHELFEGGAVRMGTEKELRQWSDLAASAGGAA